MIQSSAVKSEKVLSNCGLPLKLVLKNFQCVLFCDFLSFIILHLNMKIEKFISLQYSNKS